MLIFSSQCIFMLSCTGYVFAEYSKLLLEIGMPEVDIYMKDFFFFFDFLKNGTNDFFLISVLIKS